MTTQGVLLQGGLSPLRIASPGSDASNATFENLLFDANQSPLRKMLVGFADMPIIQNVEFTTIAYVGPAVPLSPPPPAGKHNLFEILATSTNSGSGNWHGPERFNQSGQRVGQGGIAQPTIFQPLQMTWDSAGTIGGQMFRIWYLIFRNYQ